MFEKFGQHRPLNRQSERYDRKGSACRSRPSGDVPGGGVAGIAKREVAHVDVPLIRADVAWESLAVRHVGAVAEANFDEVVGSDNARSRLTSKKTGKFKKVCLTDPDTSIATSG